MSLVLTHSREKLTVEQIEAFAISKNIKLPEAYQAFLLKNNGGIPDKGAFDYYDSDLGWWSGNQVREFLALSDKRTPVEGIVIDNLGDNIMEGMFPIAQLLTPDLICIKVTGDDAGAIYIWQQDYDISIRIADNFETFIDSLYFPEDPVDDEEY